MAKRETIIIGADHGGWELKNFIAKGLSRELDIVDVSSPHKDKHDDTLPITQRLVRICLSEQVFGLLICTSGVGVAMEANKYKGIRAVLAEDERIIRMSREHNDANVLCLPSFIDPYSALHFIELFKETKFLALERYIRRNHDLDSLGEEVIL
jgi:ribose 5-phosphate isomerase B